MGFEDDFLICNSGTIRLISTSVKTENEEDHFSMCAKFHLTGQRLTPVLIVL